MGHRNKAAHGITPSSSAGYIPGVNWVVCDICGFRLRATESRRQPHGPHKGMLVCLADYDEYNPQFEDLAAVDERITPDVVNPEADIPISGPASGTAFDEYYFDFVLT